MKKWFMLLSALLFISGCAQDEPAEKKVKAPSTQTTPKEETLHLNDVEKEQFATKLKGRLNGRPLVRDTEQQTGVMYVALLNLNEDSKEELYVLSKTPKGYMEEVFSTGEDRATLLYKHLFQTTGYEQRSIAKRSGHYFLSSVVSYVDDTNTKHLEAKFEHVGNGKLVIDEGYKVELPSGSNTPSTKSKNLVTGEYPSLKEYGKSVNSFQIEETILKNNKGQLAMNVSFNAANVKLDKVYKLLTGHTYQVKSDRAMLTNEDMPDLLASIAAFSLYEENRDVSKQTGKEQSEFAAKDIVHGALRFFDTTFTEVVESKKTYEGILYIGYNREELDPIMKQLFGQSPSWQDVTLKDTPLSKDLIVSKDYIYLPVLKKRPKANIPSVQQIIPISETEFYVELAFYQLKHQKNGLQESSYLTSEGNWSEEMKRQVKKSDKHLGYAIVSKKETVTIQKLVFDEILTYEQLIK